jgi:hypothetical protein
MLVRMLLLGHGLSKETTESTVETMLTRHHRPVGITRTQSGSTLIAVLDTPELLSRHWDTIAVLQLEIAICNLH